MKTKETFPAVNKVTFSDVLDAFRLGWKDFFSAPLFGLFFGGVYALGGLVLIYAVAVLKIFWLAYPLIIGFALMGPFIATGLYEISRRLENNQELDWPGVLGVVAQQRNRELGWMAFVMLFIFWVWMYQARTIFAVFFGSSGFATVEGFLGAVFSTQTGLMFLAVGNLVGAIISLVLFTLTVISCPLLLDRDSDFVTAMLTSIRTVLASPLVMIAWGLFVVSCIVISAIPAFAGLLVVLPVLGHATWHLYRRAVAH